MGLFAPTQELDDLAAAALMAVGVIAVRVLLSPATIAIKGDTDMAWGLCKVEIFDNPPLIERVEQRFDLATNTS